ncbi:MAG: S8 family serine peptidase [Trueperaceae bacterium]
MKRLVGFVVAVLLLVAGCGQFEPNPELDPQGTLRQDGTGETKTDYTEDPVQLTQTEYAIVTFKSPPAASYRGGIGDLRRTRPEPGQRFDENSPQARAYLRHLENEHANFRSFLRREARAAEIVDELFVTLNAVAVKLNGATLSQLERGPDVRASDYSALYRPTMSESVGLVGADEFWLDTGLRGAGVRVAIIDSGIDRASPFFDCKSFAKPKAYASGAAFDPSNVFVNDHGTHVAGTVAGCTGTEGPLGLVLSGVAPEAELYDYNVFPGYGAGWVAFGGSALSHDIAAAIEDAVLDDMQVINMSLGGSVTGPHDFLAEAANSAVDAGVVVVSSAGNSGPGQYTVGSPGSAAKVLAVAATTNAHTLVLPLRVDYDGDGSQDAQFEAAQGDFDPFLEQPADQQPLVLASAHGDELACSALDPVPAGSVVLISRGACTFTTKVANAANAGAFGAVVYNVNPSEGPIAMAGEGTIPAVGISFEAGTEILAGFLTGDTTVTIDGSALVQGAATADLLASFSSRGPAPFTGVIKPELAAPGVNILSSVFDGEFAMFNGTSMASPHVAGAAALLLAARPELSAEQVKAALVNSAVSLVDPESGSEYAVHEVGNGRLDAAAANDLDFVVSPPTASFGYHNFGGRSKVRSVELTVTALDGAANCTATSDGGDVSVDSPSFNPSPAATVNVSLADADTRSGDAEGYLTIICDGQSVRVPWASYQTSNVPF